MGILASLVALALIATTRGQLVDVFELAYPTGWYGVYDAIGGLATDLAVIFITVAVLLVRRAAGLRLGIALVAFLPLPLAALAGAPCLNWTHPSALCGVWSVVVVEAAIPVVLVAAVAFVATARHRAVRLAGIAVASAFVVSVAAAYVVLTPKEPGQCGYHAEVTKRANCVKAFAIRANDAALCRAIEFRTTRFLCLQEIAFATKRPQLCDEIADTGPLPPYSSPSALYRDGCFQNMAYTLHDRRQCARIEEAKLRAGCEQAVPQEGHD